MIKMPGKNNFDGYFNVFDWSAPVYEGSEEILKKIKKLKIIGKKIKNIRGIGAACSSGLPRTTRSLFRRIRHAGVPAEAEIYTLSSYNNFYTPNCTAICEPLIIEFIDGTNFEFLPLASNRARISENTIPSGIKDGLNHCNFNLSQILDKDFSECTIKNTCIYINKTTRTVNELSSYDKQYREHENHPDIDYRYIFEIEEKHENGHSSPSTFSLILSHHQRSGWFSVSIHSRPWTPLENIEIDKQINARVPLNQLYLDPATNGSVFWIGLYDNKKTTRRAQEYLKRDYYLCIEEDDVLDFFAKIFKKYFVEKHQEKDEYRDNGFDWYGNNIYTFKSMQQIIADFREIITRIRKSPESTEFENYRKWFRKSYNRSSIDLYQEITDTEAEAYLNEFMLMVADYYERFCNFMEKLMKTAGKGMINIEGP